MSTRTLSLADQFEALSFRESVELTQHLVRWLTREIHINRGKSVCALARLIVDARSLAQALDPDDVVAALTLVEILEGLDDNEHRASNDDPSS